MKSKHLDHKHEAFSMNCGRSSSVVPRILVGAMVTLAGCAYDNTVGYAPQGYSSGYEPALTAPGPGRFDRQNVISVEVFTNQLSPYGQWVASRFGRAFRPDVPQGWRPYVNGRWGEDRLWISDDPWGWATDHYGRWGFDAQIGWVWVPGTEWAPSWVAWREDPGQSVTGWAPVPPGVSYSLSFGFGSGFGYNDYDNWYGPSWVWVPQGSLYQRGFGGRILPWRYGADYWGGSRWQYQPGFGGRPRQTYHAQPDGYYQGRPSQGGYAPPRHPEGENWQEHPPQRAYGQQDQSQDDNWKGRRGNDGDGRQPGGSRASISSTIGAGIVANGGVGTQQSGADRPSMTYAEQPRPAPAVQMQQPRPQRAP
jgi:hypothetical protein